MHFFLAIALAFTIATRVAFAGKDAEDPVKIMKALLCSEELQEMGNELEECMSKTESERHDEINIKCSPGLSGPSPSEMRQYFCDIKMEELKKSMKCMAEEFENAEDKEQLMDDMKLSMECFKEVIKRWKEEQEEN